MPRPALKYTLDSFNIPASLVERWGITVRNNKLTYTLWKKLTSAIEKQAKLHNTLRHNNEQSLLPIITTQIVLKIIYALTQRKEVDAKYIAKILDTDVRTAQRHLKNMVEISKTFKHYDLNVSMECRLRLPPPYVCPFNESDIPY